MTSFLALLIGLLPMAGKPPIPEAPTVVRIGHFPNVTHPQALVARSFAREGKGWFEERLGPRMKVEWYVYNAGPSAAEAIFTRAVDLTYIGPSPAINAFARSRGKEIRIVSGAVDGGAALVVHQESTLKEPIDFRGKKIVTPQFGNTQDVSARAWLKSGGLKIVQGGGDAYVIPAANPDQLPLFKSGKVDGVWTVEPWVSRLLRDADGRILIEDREVVTTVLVSSARFREANPELTAKVVKAHRELTDWINAHPEEAQRRVVEELSVLTRTRVAPDLIAEAWKRMVITNSINIANLEAFVQNAREAGFLRSVPPLSELVPSSQPAAPLP